MTKLMPGTPAPGLDLDTLDGPWKLAEQSPKNFTMVVFFRGLHCPVCKGFLRELEGLIPAYAEAGTDIIAVSMDPKKRAERTKVDWELDKLTIAYGLSEVQARAWGLYVSEAVKEAETSVFCEPGLFLVDPAGSLYLINISNMPFARPDVAGLPAKIKFAVENSYPPRGTKS